jgi:hypothetical protein
VGYVTEVGVLFPESVCTSISGRSDRGDLKRFYSLRKDVRIGGCGLEGDGFLAAPYIGFEDMAQLGRPRSRSKEPDAKSGLAIGG